MWGREGREDARDASWGEGGTGGEGSRSIAGGSTCSGVTRISGTRKDAGEEVLSRGGIRGECTDGKELDLEFEGGAREIESVKVVKGRANAELAYSSV
jgi:hypothetical protein